MSRLEKKFKMQNASSQSDLLNLLDEKMQARLGRAGCSHQLLTNRASPPFSWKVLEGEVGLTGTTGQSSLALF